MQKLSLFLLFTLFACGGSLSDEQRKEMREAQAKQTVRKVTEAEILETAFARGRKILEEVKKDSAKREALSNQYNATIRFVKPGEATGLAIEQLLIEAYLVSIIEGGIADNVQKIPGDSLLYTYPVADTLADGAIAIQGMWSVHMAVKDIILSMD